MRPGQRKRCYFLTNDIHIMQYLIPKYTSYIMDIVVAPEKNDFLY